MTAVFDSHLAVSHNDRANRHLARLERWNETERTAMARSKENPSIPFDVLVAAIRQLSPSDKRRLWEMLKQEVTRAEQELAQQDLTLRGEVHEMRDDHAPPDYLIPEE